MKRYIVADKIFFTLDEATQYANFIAKVSRIIVAIEELKV